MERHSTIFTVLLALIVSLSNATNWCGITCKDHFGKVYQHIMCTIKQNQPAQKCNHVVKQGLDQSEINLIINYHNQIRRSVANLSPLVWDDTLATVAQRWANQCDYQHHDKCRNLGNAEYESAGQNMGYKWRSAGDADLQKDVMAKWVSESRLVNRNMIKSFPQYSKGIGHYTQMVWAKTTKIGCGFVKFSERKFIDNEYSDGYSNFLVCNYARGGNVWGQPVY